MKSCDLDIKKDGYVLASYLEAVIGRLVDAVDTELAKRDAEISALRREIEAERRLRLAMKSR